MIPKAYVVEDDVFVAHSLLLQLEGDYDPRHFLSADDFLAQISTLPPGCVLMDIRLPGRDGVSALREMKDRGIDWPVIMMTGHPDYRIAVAGLRLGAIDFLEKPFSNDDLLHGLAKAAEHLEHARGRS